MKPSTNTFSRRTPSSDLVFSFGFSIVMHAVLLLADPLGHFNVSDRLKEQQNGVLIVNLKDRVPEDHQKIVGSSRPAAVRKVAQGIGEKIQTMKAAGRNSLLSLKSKAPVTSAKPISTVHEPVPVANAPKADSAPVSPVPVPVPAEEEVVEPYQPPVFVPEEPDITVTDKLKPKSDTIEPDEKPLVPSSSDLRKEEIASEERSVATPFPALHEVHEPVKSEVLHPVPDTAAPVEREESHAAPVNQEPVKADEQPVVLPVPEVQEPIKPETLPPAPVVAAAAAPEERQTAPVKAAPAKIVETKAAASVNKKTISLSLLKRFETVKDPIRTGVPVSRPMVKITTPAIKKLRNRVQEIAGQVQGNGITRAILSLNGDLVTVPVENNKFHWEGALKDGKNTISVSVWDRNRYSATDQVIVEAMPVRNGFALSLEEPGAGVVTSPVITVKGRVGDRTVDTVRLIVNQESVEAAVENGLFEKTVLCKEGENFLQAEAVNSKGVSARSSVLKIMVVNQKAPDILVHLYWESPDIELRPEITRKIRDNLDDQQGAVSAVEISALMFAHEGYREKIFAVYEAKAGVYVLSVIGGKRTKCLLLVSVPSKRKRRLFGPMLIKEEGTFIGRLLMPEGIYWDEDEWFTGQIENGDSITKYNSPEGMTWKEMK